MRRRPQSLLLSALKTPRRLWVLRFTEHQHDELQVRQEPHQHRVEEDGTKGDRDRHQQGLPAPEHEVGVVHDHEALDLQSRKVANGRQPNLPPQHHKPADDVAQRFLRVSWSKFRYPVVLPARRRCPAILSDACEVVWWSGSCLHRCHLSQ